MHHALRLQKIHQGCEVAGLNHQTENTARRRCLSSNTAPARRHGLLGTPRDAGGDTVTLEQGACVGGAQCSPGAEQACTHLTGTQKCGPVDTAFITVVERNLKDSGLDQHLTPHHLVRVIQIVRHLTQLFRRTTDQYRGRLRAYRNSPAVWTVQRAIKHGLGAQGKTDSRVGIIVVPGCSRA